MRTLLKMVFGLLFVTTVSGAVILQFHARQLQRQWDPDLARRNHQPIPVRTVNVEEENVEELIGGTAVTMPSAAATISMFLNTDQVSDCLVRSVEVEAGQVVKKDQPVLRFADELFAATVAQRQATLLKKQEDYEAFTRLWKTSGISNLQWRESKLAVASAELQLKLAEYQLAACTVHSPLDGVIAQLNVVPGTRVTRPTELAIVHRLDPIHVQMDYPTKRIDALRLGQEAKVVLDAYPGEEFVGKVIQVATTADTRTRVLPVTIAVDNPNNRIRAGITGFVRIPVDKASAVIPQVAVIDKQDKAMVFLVEDGRAKIREIKSGPVLDSGQVEVTSGLRAGDQVIVYGQDRLRENDVVNVNWRQWTHRGDQ